MTVQLPDVIFESCIRKIFPATILLYNMTEYCFISIGKAPLKDAVKTEEYKNKFYSITTHCH